MRRIEARGRVLLAIDVRGEPTVFVELADVPELVAAVVAAADGAAHVCPRSCFCNL